MRKLLTVIGVAIVVVAARPQLAEHFMSAVIQPQPRAAATTDGTGAPRQQANYAARQVTLRNDGRGHFEVEARVEGRSMDFLVDTGATMIAIRETSAARLGIHPRVSDYTVRTQTANGTGKAARVQLASVEISGITVRDVEAFVVPDDQLSMNLLGMSFLSRVKWTHDRGRLVLEQ